ncbi:MAG: 50S ribosomal protein L5 [Planctomycetota bacterium]
MARLKERYQSEIIPKLKERFSIENPHAVPTLQKVVVSMGIGKAIENKSRLDEGVAHLTAVTGQKAVITKAKRSVSGFKLREGNPIGAMVTLRRDRMYEFVDRLIAVTIPRIRDFRGLNPKAFDGRGNYNLGLVDQTVFVEIDVDRLEFYQGMSVTFVTSAPDDEQAEFLLRSLGMPFRDQ